MRWGVLPVEKALETKRDPEKTAGSRDARVVLDALAIGAVVVVAISVRALVVLRTEAVDKSLAEGIRVRRNPLVWVAALAAGVSASSLEIMGGEC